MYDIPGNNWTKSDLKLKSPRFGHQCARLNNTVVIIGGYKDKDYADYANTLELWRNGKFESINTQIWIPQLNLETWRDSLLFIGPTINRNLRPKVFQEELPFEEPFHLPSKSPSSKTYPLKVLRKGGVSLKLPYGFLTSCQGIRDIIAFSLINTFNIALKSMIIIL